MTLTQNSSLIGDTHFSCDEWWELIDCDPNRKFELLWVTTQTSCQGPLLPKFYWMKLHTRTTSTSHELSTMLEKDCSGSNSSRKQTLKKNTLYSFFYIGTITYTMYRFCQSHKYINKYNWKLCISIKKWLEYMTRSADWKQSSLQSHIIESSSDYSFCQETLSLSFRDKYCRGERRGDTQ